MIWQYVLICVLALLLIGACVVAAFLWSIVRGMLEVYRDVLERHRG